MVLRISTSISPLARDGKRCSGVRAHVLDRLGVAEDRGGDRLAVVDVEALEGALGRLEAEARHRVVDAAVERAAVGHRGQGATAGLGAAVGLLLAAGLFVVASVVAAGRAEQARHHEGGGDGERTCASEHCGFPPCRKAVGASGTPALVPPHGLPCWTDQRPRPYRRATGRSGATCCNLGTQPPSEARSVSVRGRGRADERLEAPPVRRDRSRGSRERCRPARW